MKRSFLQFAFICFVIILASGTAYAANEYFRSLNSGNWNSNSTWEMSTDNGTTWIAATKTPNDSSGVITIRSPNTVTVTVSVNADQLTVNTGGTISINNLVNLTILDGSGEDLVMNSGGTISGSGSVQTQGAGVVLNVHGGANFNSPLRVASGTTTSYDSFNPLTAVHNGSITVDAGATLSAAAGGYAIRANNTVTNNGKITGSGSTFIMRGATLTNNDTIRTTFLQLDTTISLSGTGVIASSLITVGSSGNISLASNVTFSPVTSMTVNTGAVISPNAKVLTFTAGTFQLNSGATVSNSGTFQTQNNVYLNIKNGSSFNAPLKVNNGITASSDNAPPYIAVFKGTITIDAGATLRVSDGGYYVLANNDVTNNGSIIGSGSTFYMRGALLANAGSVSVSAFEFDSTTSVSGSGTYTSNTITIGSSGNITLVNNVTFSPVNSFTIVSGGLFNPGSKTFTFTSGTFTLYNGAVVSGSGPSAGVMQTQGNVTFNFRTGSTFNSAIKANTGTLTAYNSDAPYNAVFSGIMSVDAGAVLQVQPGGYSVQANNSVINNGSITGSGSTFIMRGSSLFNNNSISTTYLNLDSVVSLSGTGTFTSSYITIGSSGNVSLSNNLTFSPAVNLTINTGGILNPNSRTFTFNAGTIILKNGAVISTTGTFQTQGTVAMIIRSGSAFNAPLKVNTGTTTSYDDGSPYIARFNGSVTVDAGAVLNAYSSGYFIQANSSLTNSGAITGPGSTLIIKGSSFVNNGSVTIYSTQFDTATSLSGSGTFTGTSILIGGSGNVSLANNIAFSPSNSFTINTGGTLNPSTFTLTLSTATFRVNSGATVTNSGLLQTQGTITTFLKNGSNFNVPFKVNTGTNTAYDDGSPYVATFNGTVTVDAGATLTTVGGGYSIRLINNVTNNGLISAGGGSPVSFAGTTFTNNGNITAVLFYFESGSHTLQGTGSWGTNANILTGSTVTLASNHQMQSVSIASAGTLNLSTFKLLLTASNPISNSGTFTTTNGTVEYNGTSSQSVSTTNITYNRLRINNPAGAVLSGAVTVNDTLSVILGDLDLSGSVLTISPTGFLKETAGNTVKGSSGYMTTTRTLNAPSGLNVGGFGAVLTTSANLGSTEIRRGHAVQSGLSGNTSILRYYDILPSTNTGLNATLTFNYDDSELNGKVEAGMGLFSSTNSGTTWTSRGGTVNISANTVTLSGLASFSRWSLSSPTPVAVQIKLIMQGFYNSATGRLYMRDTVRVYLRSTSTPFAVVDSAKSVIDSVTFAGSFLFQNAPSGTYYIQTKHRNSIETWSKLNGETYTLGSAFNYDFTGSSSQAFGSNMIQVNASPLRFAIYGGDVNQDGTVDATDVSAIDNDAFYFAGGYVPTDITGDSFVDATDFAIADNNAANFISVIRP